MSALIRRDRFDDLFPDFFRRLARPMGMQDDTIEEIRLDVTEHDKEYEVLAQLPGVRKEDVRVSVDGNFVSISAEVRKEKEDKSGGRVLVKETFFGSSSRGFSLPHEIDAKGVVAKLDNGVLRLTLPKRDTATGRSIAVQ